MILTLYNFYNIVSVKILKNVRINKINYLVKTNVSCLQQYGSIFGYKVKYKNNINMLNSLWSVSIGACVSAQVLFLPGWKSGTKVAATVIGVE